MDMKRQQQIAELLPIAGTTAVVPLLRSISHGNHGQFADCVIDALYDGGLIDENDNLTDKAREILKRGDF